MSAIRIPKNKRPKTQRVYTQWGHAAHYLLDWQSPNDSTETALCGISPIQPMGAWLGTGTQDEWDLAAQLPVCLNCERALRRSWL